jgi:phosphoribosylformylglycinamidine synthase subunit PurQ / glutaminase
MPKPRVLVLRAPGTNCDVETAYAFELAGAEPVRLHVNQLIEHPALASTYQILCFPGGFSYGDDIAAGRILATQLHTFLADTLETFRGQDRLVLGICNGFQIMMRLGIFFENGTKNQPATLTWNKQGRFEDRWVHLKSETDNCVFLKRIEKMYLPMAHAEGRFLFRDHAATDELMDQKQVVLRYCGADGTSSDSILPFPINPNGAELNVAGICDASGRIFGLMPHPERHLFPTNHPQWTRRDEQPEHGEGLRLFQNAVAYFG